jgi:hypothetical protein
MWKEKMAAFVPNFRGNTQGNLKAAIHSTDYNTPAEECGIFQLFGSVITNVAKCAREIRSTIVVAKAAFKMMKALLTSKLD